MDSVTPAPRDSPPHQYLFILPSIYTGGGSDTKKWVGYASQTTSFV